MRILVANANGYIGRRLTERLLLEEGAEIRLLVSDAKTVQDLAGPRVAVFDGDLLDRRILGRALREIDVAYYPIRFFAADTWSRELHAAFAARFRDACVDAGVKRVIYLGGFEFRGESEGGLLGTDKVSEILGAGSPEFELVWLETGLIVGSGSLLFEALRSLVRNLPVLVLPRWADERLDSVAVRDLLEYLAAARDCPLPPAGRLRIGSGEMPFRAMVEAMAKAMLSSKKTYRLPFLLPRASSLALMLTTPLSWSMARLLIRTLGATSDLRSGVSHEAVENLFPAIKPASFERAARWALREMESGQMVSRWTDSLAGISFTHSEEEVAKAIFRDVRTASIRGIKPGRVFQAVKSIGGGRGWFSFDFLWRIRGLLDKVAGGFGVSLGRRLDSDLRIGDMLDVWKVVDLRANERLLLEAQMKVFGRAWLEFRIDGDTLIQTAHHLPAGLMGRLYWYAMLPFHFFIFPDMIQSIVEQARSQPSG